MFSGKEIIEQSEKLEMSGCKTIRHYMAKQWGIDWDNKPALVSLAEVLDKIMYVESVKYNGYTQYEWMPR